MKHKKKDSKKKLSVLIEGDYYFENGLMVFTEQYHLKRGYCCKSGCKHCPFKKEINSIP